MSSDASEPAPLNYCCVLMPNGSLSKAGLVMFLIALALPMWIIAAWAWMSGAWMVLPFAGLEFVAVAWLLLYCVRQNAYREVVWVSDTLIRVERGMGFPQEKFEFHRLWSQILLESAEKSPVSARLILRSGARAVELGRCLTDDERRDVAVKLRQAIGPVGS
jgi:uncharacterized membrane protein